MPDSISDPTSNRFVRVAQLYDDTAESQAQRIAAATNEPPAGQKQLSPDEIRMAWNHSPSPQPEVDFWQMHDWALHVNLGQLGPDAKPEDVTAAHNAAETQALNAIFPYRGPLIGIGSRVLPDQVALAERIRRMADNTPESEDVPPQAIAPQQTGGVAA